MHETEFPNSVRRIFLGLCETQNRAISVAIFGREKRNVESETSMFCLVAGYIPQSNDVRYLQVDPLHNGVRSVY